MEQGLKRTSVGRRQSLELNERQQESFPGLKSPSIALQQQTRRSFSNQRSRPSRFNLPPFFIPQKKLQIPRSHEIPRSQRLFSAPHLVGTSFKRVPTEIRVSVTRWGRPVWLMGRKKKKLKTRCWIKKRIMSALRFSADRQLRPKLIKGA